MQPPCAFDAPFSSCTSELQALTCCSATRLRNSAKWVKVVSLEVGVQCDSSNKQSINLECVEFSSQEAHRQCDKRVESMVAARVQRGETKRNEVGKRQTPELHSATGPCAYFR
ncbi:hypothetical protein PMIN02_005996 [Paraphaeosphaeria minitans]